MPELPSGTVTFLFTDIEGSTRLWEQHPEAMRLALARHHALITTEIERRGGVLVKSQGEGDSVFAAFARAADAVAAACALQQALLAEPWPAETPLRVRVALHTGEADLREGDYYGPAVNRCARLRSAGHGGQILLSLAAGEQLHDHLPAGTSLRDLGERRLKDLIRPERVFQLVGPGLRQEFPPLNTLDLRPNNLPAQSTPLIGREEDLRTVCDLVRREEIRLVTLTGAGGTGKTRLGLQAAAELLDDFVSGVFLVELAPISDPALVASAIAQALGVRETGGTTLRESLKGFFREKSMLLLLDNFEQIVEAAPLVAELLAAAPRLKLLVTSRTVLRLQGEHQCPVSPLAVPDAQRRPSAETLARYAASSC